MTPVVFGCEGALLAGMLHDGGGDDGVLLVTGGAQTRVGAHRMFVDLAVRLAAADIPVFRFDRRGIGDSDGDDAGFEAAGPDIAAASAAFRQSRPNLRRIVGVGHCDGAAALALAPRSVDGLVLLNLWTLDNDGAPAAPVIRDHYRRRLLQPASWRRLVSGQVDVFGAVGSLLSARREPALSDLAERIAGSLAAAGKPYRLIMSGRDATALAAKPLTARIGHCHWITGADHSFSNAAHLAELVDTVAEFVKREW